MIRIYSNNGSASIGVEIPSFFLCLLILLCFPLPVKGAPSRPPENIYDNRNPFPEKFFLNIDDGKITLVARNNPLGPILEEIGQRSGVKIKISPSLRSKKITVSWIDILLEDGVKKIAEDSGLLFRKDEDGNFYLSELNSVPETVEQSIQIQEAQAANDGPGKNISQNTHSENNIFLNEMVIRFKQGISEQDINNFLSDSNIKVKKYITALKYHVLSLPEGMSYYDAMVLFKSKKMLYHAEPDYLVPVK